MQKHFLFLYVFIQILVGGVLFPSSRLYSTVPNPSEESRFQEEMKILVLVIASDQLPIWHELQNVWRTYMHLDPDHVEVYFIKRDPDLSTSCEIKGDVIWSKGEENFIPGILDKTIISMEAMLPRLSEFDYVIRTNISSFYYFPRLFEFLKRLPKEKCYAGFWGEPYQGSFRDWWWICGAGIIFSPDVVELLVQNKSRLLNNDTIDDVAIARFLKKHKIRINQDPLSLPMIVESIEEWEANKNHIPAHTFHFRIKNHIPELRITDDVTIHRDLVRMFYNEVP